MGSLKHRVMSALRLLIGKLPTLSNARWMKSLISLFLAFAIGLSIGLWTRQKTASIQTETVSASNQLRNLVEENATSIRNSTDEAERQKKIEALLEKILNLFMIDISLRMTQKPLVIADVPVAVSTPGLAPPNATPLRVERPTVDRSSILQLEKALLRATPNEALADLEKLKVSDFGDLLKTSQPLAAEQIRELYGRWRGNLEYIDGRATEGLSVSVGPRGPDVYRYSITIEKSGRRRSNSSGEGSLKDFSGGGNESPAVYVSIAGGEQYLQMYHVLSSQNWMGNLYEKKGDAYVPVGRFTLTRTRSN